MIKDEMKKLWEGLSGGVEGIFEKYAKARAASDKQYQNQLDQAKQDYRAEQNAASAQARIGERNAQEMLSAHGLGKSGESLHAKLMNGLVRNDAMQEAADRYGDRILGLETAKESADAKSDGEMLSEMTGLSKELYALQQEEARREQEALAADRQLSLKEKQQNAEQSLEEQKLKLERDKLAEESRQFDKDFDEETKKLIEEYQEDIVELENSVSRYEGLLQQKEDGGSGGWGELGDQDGTMPDLPPVELYEQILVESRDGLDWWNNEEEYLAEYRSRVQKKVKTVLENPAISENYRNALEVYARVGGFL